MSARSATIGLPVPIVATTPVRANGYLYLTPISSSRSRTNRLVLISSYANSGYSCMDRLAALTHITASLLFAVCRISSFHPFLVTLLVAVIQVVLTLLGGGGNGDKRGWLRGISSSKCDREVE